MYNCNAKYTSLNFRLGCFASHSSSGKRVACDDEHPHAMCKRPQTFHLGLEHMCVAVETTLYRVMCNRHPNSLKPAAKIFPLAHKDATCELGEGNTTGGGGHTQKGGWLLKDITHFEWIFNAWLSTSERRCSTIHIYVYVNGVCCKLEKSIGGCKNSAFVSTSV